MCHQNPGNYKTGLPKYSQTSWSFTGSVYAKWSHCQGHCWGRLAAAAVAGFVSQPVGVCWCCLFCRLSILHWVWKYFNSLPSIRSGSSHQYYSPWELHCSNRGSYKQCNTNSALSPKMRLFIPVLRTVGFYSQEVKIDFMYRKALLDPAKTDKLSTIFGNVFPLRNHHIVLRVNPITLSRGLTLCLWPPQLSLRCVPDADCFLAVEKQSRSCLRRRLSSARSFLRCSITAVLGFFHHRRDNFEINWFR